MREKEWTLQPQRYKTDRMRLGNPVYRTTPTVDHPLFVGGGDLVQLGGGPHAYVEVISHTGILWVENGEWVGRALLAEPSLETLSYIPPHIRALGGVLHFIAKEQP